MIKEKERLLLERWGQERNYTSFISDGVFDEALWDSQPVKITFVLKEANWTCGPVDLCKWLLSEPKGRYWKTWNNIARWSKALLEGGGYPRCLSKPDKSYWLSRVSFINLKKEGGGPRASNDLLRQFAAEDAPFICEQLALYSPDIVICCGWWVVADILHQNVLLKNTLGEWRKTAGGFDYFHVRLGENAVPVPVVSFYHPQCIASHAVFEERYDSIRKIGGELLPGKVTL